MAKTETPEQCKVRWSGAFAPLIGKRIVSISYMDADEQEHLGWHSAAIVFTLEDGTRLMPSRDDEGNDAGALFIQSHDIKIPNTAPVI